MLHIKQVEKADDIQTAQILFATADSLEYTNGPDFAGCTGIDQGDIDGDGDIDFVAVNGGKELNEVFTWIADNLTFGQLIWEKGDDGNPQWIHVSDATARFGKSGEILRFDPSGSPKYKPCDKFGKRT